MTATSPRRARRAAVVTCALAAVAVSASPAAASHPSGPKRTDARVVRVIDGDQIVVRTAARTAKYKLLGVRAPALDDCFGRRAKSRLRALLPAGARVTVIARRRGARSVVVVRRGVGVNRMLVQGGHAKASLRDGSRLSRLLAAAQERARDAERGLWSACERQDAEVDTRDNPVNDADQQQVVRPGAPAAPQATRRSQAEFQALLENTVLTRVSNDSDFGGSTNRNDFTFCPAGRYDFRSESINNGFPSQFQESGRWRITELRRDREQQADAAVLELVTEQSDLESFDPQAPESDRTFNLLIEAFDDGRIHVNQQAAQPSEATTCA